MKDNVRSKHLGKENKGEEKNIIRSATKREKKNHHYAAGSLKGGSS
jgi:hypothetical protein